MIKVALNGFGRIGKHVVKLILEDKDCGIEIVAINSPSGAKSHAPLFEYDSIYGKYPGTVEATDDSLIINGKVIPFLRESDPNNLNWKEIGADIIIDASGKFTGREAAEVHLKQGAKKVLITAPGKGVDATIVIGVNDEIYNPAEHNIISVASCTTNCLAPVVKVLNDKVGIISGSMTTIHAYTGDQRLVDKPHKDLRRARAAALSIIPTTTGAAKALGEVIPEMKGKMDGCAFRVPTPTVSLVDLVAEVKRDVTVEEINQYFAEYAAGEMKGVLGVSPLPLVSVDYTKDSRSSIVDTLSTMVIQDRLVKVCSWYDNEYGYSNRVVDVIKMVGKDL